MAKVTVLEKSCIYFGKVIIPRAVYCEIIAGKGKGGDAVIIENLIKKRKIEVKNVREKALIGKAKEFNITGGEGEVLALYWQEEAEYIATDDDNVRKKRTLLDLKVIGTPAILIKLYHEKVIDEKKYRESVLALKKIGWFNSEVIDYMLGEVERWEMQ